MVRIRSGGVLVSGKPVNGGFLPVWGRLERVGLIHGVEAGSQVRVELAHCMTCGTGFVWGATITG